MNKIFSLAVLAILALVSAASAQTCDCESLQSQIDELTDQVTDLQIQVETLIDLMDTQTLGNVVSLNNTGVADTKSADTFDPIIFGDCTVEYYYQDLAKTNSGKNILEVFLFFENTSETDTMSFSSQIRLEAYQGGIGLHEGAAITGATKYLRPGRKAVIQKYYVLLSPEIPVELEFTPLRSDAAPEIRTIQLQ